MITTLTLKRLPTDPEQALSGFPTVFPRSIRTDSASSAATESVLQSPSSRMLLQHDGKASKQTGQDDNQAVGLPEMKSRCARAAVAVVGRSVGCARNSVKDLVRVRRRGGCWLRGSSGAGIWLLGVLGTA